VILPLPFEIKESLPLFCEVHLTVLKWVQKDKFALADLPLLF
jgi:hypothetical protein